jgi:hypothetical protein
VLDTSCRGRAWGLGVTCCPCQSGVALRECFRNCVGLRGILSPKSAMTPQGRVNVQSLFVPGLSRTTVLQWKRVTTEGNIS